MTKQVLRHRDNPMECGNAKIRLRVESKGWNWYKPGKIASFVGRFCFPRQFSGQFWSTFDFLKVFFVNFQAFWDFFKAFRSILMSFWLRRHFRGYLEANFGFSRQFWTIFGLSQGFLVNSEAFLHFFKVSSLIFKRFWAFLRVFACYLPPDADFWPCKPLPDFFFVIFEFFSPFSANPTVNRTSADPLKPFSVPPTPLRTFVKSIKKFPRWKIETNRRAKRKFFLRGVAGKFCNLKQLWKKKF